MSKSASERKNRSESILKEQAVPFISHLPTVEDENSVRMRSLEEIAWRAMALNIVAVKGEGLDHKRALELSERYALEQAFTPKERDFVFNSEPSENDRVQFSWKYECYWVLLWALNYVDELGAPDHVCDVETAVQILVDRSAEEFIRDAKLRNTDAILDATDITYRYDWACVDSRLNGTVIPKWLNCSVVMEQHRALNWLVGYGDSADWDDVTMDT